MLKNPLKLLTWNVNGIRASASKGLLQTIEKLTPDIICMQEIKANANIVEDLCAELLPDYRLYCSSAEKAGYSGVACLVRNNLTAKQVNFTNHSTTLPEKLFNNDQKELVKLFGNEGRFSILRSSELSLINVYVPSGTSGPDRQALKMQFLELFSIFLEAELQIQKNIIICGDINICHQDIDIHHPKQATKLKLTGFLPEERAWVSQLLEGSFADCFRQIHPLTSNIYSWWSYRAGSRSKNLGWRIDYFFCSRSLCAMINDVSIHGDILGSDHCPVSLELNLK